MIGYFCMIIIPVINACQQVRFHWLIDQLISYLGGKLIISKWSFLYLKVVNSDYTDLYLCHKGKHKYNDLIQGID